MIQEKLNILKENNIIDKKTFDEMHEVLKYLKHKKVIDEEDVADTFITHLAMAVSREKSGEDQVDFVDEAIKNELIDAPEYKQAVQLWEEISEFLTVEFPQAENDYFYLHLVTMLQLKD